MAALEIEVRIVSFESRDRISWYMQDIEHGWPVLSDPSREAYAAYGLGRASFVRAWLSPRTVLHYLRSALRGRLPGRPVDDTLQLGGDFLIDPQGTIRFVHSSVEPADRPDIEAVLALVGRT